MAFDVNGRELAVADGLANSMGPEANATMHLFDVARRRADGTLIGLLGYVTGLAFAPGGTRRAVTDTGPPEQGPDGQTAGTVAIWNVRSHKMEGQPLSESPAASGGATFSGDNRTVVAGLRDGTLRVWDADTHLALGSPVRADRGA